MPSFLPSIKWSRFPQSPFSPTRSDSTSLPPVEPSQESSEEVPSRPLPGQLLVQNSSSTVALSSTPVNGHSSQHQPSDAADPAADEPHVSEADVVPATSILDEVDQADVMPNQASYPLEESISTPSDAEPASTVSMATSDPIRTPVVHSEECPLPEDLSSMPPSNISAPDNLVTPTGNETSDKTNKPSAQDAQDRLGTTVYQPTSADATSPADITESSSPVEATPNEMNDQARAAIIKAELLSPSPGDADKENAPEHGEAADQSLPSPSDTKLKSKKNRFERMTSPLRSSNPLPHHEQEANPGLERATSGKRKNQVPIGDRLKGVIEQVKGKVKKDKEAVIYGKRLSRGELGV